MELPAQHLALLWCCIQTVLQFALGYYLDTDFELDCPETINQNILWSLKTPFGVPDRALRSVPPGFSIRPSQIARAGLGVYAETFIPRNTWLGEYEGIILPAESMNNDTDDTYMWRVRVTQEDEVVYFIDALLPQTSNWLRYVNCPRNTEEENVSVHYCYGKIYYRTYKDVAPGQELLVYYGDDYAEWLGIDTSQFATYISN